MSGSRTRSAAELAAERDHLLASLADLEREHAAGDVEDKDFAELHGHYVARAAEVLRALERAATPAGAAPAPAAAPQSRTRRFRRVLGRRRVRRLLGALALVWLLGALALVAADLAGVRLPGEPITGSVALPSTVQLREELASARVLGDQGKLAPAIALYDAVLAQVPGEPEALAYRAWLVRLAGLAGHAPATVRLADDALARAVRAAPGYANARALYGLALLDDGHDPLRATVQFQAFLADHPQATLLDRLGPTMAGAFRSAHEPVPVALARAGAAHTGRRATG